MMQFEIVTLTLLSAILCLSLVAGLFVSHKSCNDKPSGTYVAHPSNCNKYLLCNGLRSLVGECPNGTYFNGLVLSCDTSSHNCKGLKAKTNQMKTETLAEVKNATAKVQLIVAATAATKAATAFTSSPKELELLRPKTPITVDSSQLFKGNYANSGFVDTLAANTAHLRPICNPWLDEAFPFPGNCSYYYYCTRGFLTVRRCSISSHVRQALQHVCASDKLAKCSTFQL